MARRENQAKQAGQRSMNRAKMKKVSTSAKIITDLLRYPTFKEVNAMKSKPNAQNKQLNSPHPSNVEQLISQLKPNKYNAYLRIVADNPGIKTDELSSFIKSNNQANASQYLNGVIIPLGFVIAKFPIDNPSKSWQWYLMPVKRALKLGIDKRLRLKIFSLLGAANDE